MTFLGKNISKLLWEDAVGCKTYDHFFTIFKLLNSGESVDLKL